jgi:hypothetical protein
MGFLVKTGSDATTSAVRIARGHTGREKILRCGYHGWHDWCCEVHGGIPEDHYQHTLHFPYNDLPALEAMLEANQDDIAGVIITPIDHALNHPVELPEEGYLQGVRALCDRYGAVLIFDEIRTGFRASLGGAQQLFGVTPDLTTIGKAMGNGYPISAVVGRRPFIESLNKVFVSSTFFPNSLEMVAAHKTLEILERDKVLDAVWAHGEAFMTGCQKPGPHALHHLREGRTGPVPGSPQQLLHRDRPAWALHPALPPLLHHRAPHPGGHPAGRGDRRGVAAGGGRDRGLILAWARAPAWTSGPVRIRGSDTEDLPWHAASTPICSSTRRSRPS